MFTSTINRVPHNTAECVNERIRDRTVQSVADCLRHGPAAIERRLAEMDEEWDIERYLEDYAPTISLLGLALGIGKDRRWLIVPAVVQSFFLQHVLQGWCPPLPVLRRLGIRTADEINIERYALKALRGDFDGVSSKSQASGRNRVADAFEATRS